jgi:hypothetical protein
MSSMFGIPINVKLLADLNLGLQLVLLAVLLLAAYLAKKKKRFEAHCLILRIAIPVQVIIIIFVMLPFMSGLLQEGARSPLFYGEMILHHSLGLLVVGLWVFINLLYKGIVRVKIQLAIFMRTAFILWISTILLGIYLYFQLWT